ncbi:MAG: group II truncated hemoglobin [Gammaproteobacteria bacterium]|jgi:hemoglobin|nr:group II truncated hemoglobin [Gammaproteobacteria bacterium]
MSEQESLPPQTPYEILGDQGIKALVKAFYEVMDTHPAAKEIRAMHAENLEPVKSKLVSFLVGWMGGPPVYLAVTGTVCLTDPHAAFHIGPRQTEQWLLCMDEALIKVNASQELKEMLKLPMEHIANTVRNQDTSDPAPRDPNLIAVGR